MGKIIGIILVLFCVCNTAFAMSDDIEIAIGRQVDARLKEEYRIIDDQEINKYIEHVGLKLVSVSNRQDMVYHFVVLDTKKINSMSVPGGYIYITKGFLSRIENEAQLAAVLAREIAHIAKHHGIKRIEKNMESSVGMAEASAAPITVRSKKISKKASKILIGAHTAYYFAKLGYGKKLETEADLKGTEYLLAAGYPPEAMIKMLDIIQVEEIKKPRLVLGLVISHPKTTKRIDMVRSMRDSLKAENSALYNSAEENYYPDRYKSNVLELLK